MSYRNQILVFDCILEQLTLLCIEGCIHLHLFLRGILLIYFRRHLLRLWLRDPDNAWETPAQLQPRWDAIYKDVAEEEQVFPLEPAIRKNVSL